MGTVAITVPVPAGEVPKEPVFVTKMLVTMSSSYATGGDTVDLADQLPAGATILHAYAEPAVGYVFRYDAAADTLIALDNDLAEETATTDLDAITTTLIVFSK